MWYRSRVWHHRLVRDNSNGLAAPMLLTEHSWLMAGCRHIPRQPTPQPT